MDANGEPVVSQVDLGKIDKKISSWNRVYLTKRIVKDAKSVLMQNLLNHVDRNSFHALSTEDRQIFDNVKGKIFREIIQNPQFIIDFCDMSTTRAALDECYTDNFEYWDIFSDGNKYTEDIVELLEKVRISLEDLSAYLLCLLAFQMSQPIYSLYAITNEYYANVELSVQNKDLFLTRNGDECPLNQIYGLCSPEFVFGEQKDWETLANQFGIETTPVLTKETGELVDDFNRRKLELEIVKSCFVNFWKQKDILDPSKRGEESHRILYEQLEDSIRLYGYSRPIFDIHSIYKYQKDKNEMVATSDHVGANRQYNQFRQTRDYVNTMKFVMGLYDNKDYLDHFVKIFVQMCSIEKTKLMMKDMLESSDLDSVPGYTPLLLDSVGSQGCTQSTSSMELTRREQEDSLNSADTIERTPVMVEREDIIETQLLPETTQSPYPLDEDDNIDIAGTKIRFIYSLLYLRCSCNEGTISM